MSAEPIHSERETLIKNGRARWADGFSDSDATALSEATAPVNGFPMEYIWHTGPWKDIFDLQIDLVKSDIRRARAEDKLIVYLSCPISTRGGSYGGTNVDVAKHVERTLLERWGEAFWILNPAQYQLESKAGTGLMNQHAEQLGIDLDTLRMKAQPLGGGYMRMWTKVLVENKEDPVNTGQNFDAFYFIGPTDVQSFFMKSGETLTAGIQTYFARKFATNADFRDYFSVPEIVWEQSKPSAPLGEKEQKQRHQWGKVRKAFLRYYSLRASVNFSLGSHDEWLIFRFLNKTRRDATRNDAKYMRDGDVGEQIAGFFDGNQIDPASSEQIVSRGYSTQSTPPQD